MFYDYDIDSLLALEVMSYMVMKCLGLQIQSVFIVLFSVMTTIKVLLIFAHILHIMHMDSLFLLMMILSFQLVGMKLPIMKA